jgi:transposase
MLTDLLRAGRTGLWRAMRARAVLLGAAGESVSDIARRVGRDRKWVRHWLTRFARERLVGLQDAPRSGRPPKFSPRRAA